MTNPLPNNGSCITPSTKTNGIPEIRQKAIAAMITRGFPVKHVARKLKISASRIYHLLSDGESVLNAEIRNILDDLFETGDVRLVNIYNKALEKLDAMLSSFDKKQQFQAIDRIIKIFLARSAKNPVSIQQYFGIRSQENKPEDIDEMILRMRRERGLPEWTADDIVGMILKVRKVRGLPELPHHGMKDIISKLLKDVGLPDLADHENSSHSSPETLTPGNSPQNASSQDVPPQGAPSQDTASQEYKDFIKQIT